LWIKPPAATIAVPSNKLKYAIMKGIIAGSNQRQSSTYLGFIFVLTVGIDLGVVTMGIKFQ
jgi:hypothetical protein